MLQHVAGGGNEPTQKSTAGALLELVLSAPLVAVTLVGAALFALSRGAYDVFYHSYGVSPSELGFDYRTLLAQQAFPIAILVFVIIVATAPAVLAFRSARSIRRDADSRSRSLIEESADLARQENEAWARVQRIPAGPTEAGAREVAMNEYNRVSKEREQKTQELDEAARTKAEAVETLRKKPVVVRAIIGVAIVLVWTGIMFLQANLASPGPYSAPLGIAPLQAEVRAVTPRWLPVNRIGLGRALSWRDVLGRRAPGSPHFLLLGSNGGTTVLYERESHVVVRVPTSRIAIT